MKYACHPNGFQSTNQKSPSGWLTDAARLSNLGTVSNETRIAVVGKWQETSRNVKLAGDQFWQFGYSDWSTGRNRMLPPPNKKRNQGILLTLAFLLFLDDDGFTIFLDDAEAKELVYDHAKLVNKLNN